MDKRYLLDREEIASAERCLELAMDKGAAKARVTLSKSKMDLVGTLNGQTDKINSCLDRSLSISLFVDGRFGAFSTNRLDVGQLGSFLDKAVQTVRTLDQDPPRDLPVQERTCKRAIDGDELKLFDSTYYDITPAQRLEMALGASAFDSPETKGKAWELVSEEGEYSDNICDTLLLDSQGTRCRHLETNFDYGVEVTVKDSRGRLYNSYAWDSSTRLGGLDIGGACPEALRKAVESIGPKRLRSRHCTMVLDRECASKVVSPLLRALNAYSIQQGNSFLKDSLGQKVLPEGLTLADCPHIPRESGSRLFDSEGVATIPGTVIEGGVVKEYFINTYMSGKMQMPPTIEDASRPAVLPYLKGSDIPAGGLSLKEILVCCGEGILVTGFNGGNSSDATGDFSFGVEGFAFKNGVITSPVREMVVTGNLLTLWQGLLAAGTDARRCASRLIPSLAFEGVSFSA